MIRGLGAKSPASVRLTRLLRTISVPAIPLLVLSGVALELTIGIGGAVAIFNMHARALSDTERELDHLDVILTDQAARALQTVDLMQQTVLDDIRRDAVTTPDAVAGVRRAASCMTPWRRGSRHCRWSARFR